MKTFQFQKRNHRGSSVGEKFVKTEREFEKDGYMVRVLAILGVGKTLNLPDPDSSVGHYYQCVRTA